MGEVSVDTGFAFKKKKVIRAAFVTEEQKDSYC